MPGNMMTAMILGFHVYGGWEACMKVSSCSIIGWFYCGFSCCFHFPWVLGMFRKHFFWNSYSLLFQALVFFCHTVIWMGCSELNLCQGFIVL
jgi:hypothetical protein